MPTSANEDEDFETLLNLLASDGIDDHALSNTKLAPRGFGSRGYEDGKLNLKQIHSFYHNKRTEGNANPRDIRGGPADVSDAAPSTGGSISRSLPDIDEPPLDDEPQKPTSKSPLGQISKQAEQLTAADGHSGSRRKTSIDSLNESEAKELLRSIGYSLGISESAICRGSNFRPDSLIGQHPASIPETQKALDFVIQMDELVRRRTEYGAAASVFDADNIDSLVDRIKLWERVARSHKD